MITTIMTRSHPVIDMIKMRSDVKQLEVTWEKQGVVIEKVLKAHGLLD